MNSNGHTSALEAGHEVLQRMLRHKLDGENVHHRDATGVDADLRGTKERIVENEIESGDAEEHEQQPRGRPHDALCAY